MFLPRPRLPYWLAPLMTLAMPLLCQGTLKKFIEWCALRTFGLLAKSLSIFFDVILWQRSLFSLCESSHPVMSWSPKFQLSEAGIKVANQKSNQPKPEPNLNLAYTVWFDWLWTWTLKLKSHVCQVRSSPGHVRARITIPCLWCTEEIFDADGWSLEEALHRVKALRARRAVQLHGFS